LDQREKKIIQPRSYAARIVAQPQKTGKLIEKDKLLHSPENPT